MWWLVLLVSQLALVRAQYANEPCPAGKYRTDYQWYNEEGDGFYPICETCLAGWYSQSGYTECVSCPAGTYSSTAGAASCTACLRGKYKSNTGAGLSSLPKSWFLESHACS